MSLNIKVNDFVVRFANVNGTGSASANHMFAKSIFRMGIPVTPKNIFPSNIQGLPTWYDVRISEKGYLGRKEGVDLMVCMNPQSMQKDIATVSAGGYFLYDSTKLLHSDYIRKDITYIGIPITDICNKEYSDPRQRQLFKNIIYVGALSTLLDIEFGVLEALVSEQFKGKEKLIAPNINALQLGVKYVQEHYSYPLNIRVERRDLLKDKILLNGNKAAGIGAVYGGATVASWYPITPSTSLVEGYEKYAEKYRVDKETGKKNFAIVQAEDEAGSIRHGHWCQLEWRTFIYSNQWSGTFTDERVFRIGLLLGNSGGAGRCAAFGSFHRYANAYTTIRLAYGSLCFSW
jgi:2-oxoglutarate ferredoxin oxidoreductase subunit alpha